MTIDWRRTKFVLCLTLAVDRDFTTVELIFHVLSIQVHARDASLKEKRLWPDYGRDL